MTIATTSGSERTAANLVTMALRQAGLVYAGHLPATEDLAMGLDVLDTVLQALSAEGIIARRVKSRTMVWVAGSPCQAADDDVLDVLGDGIWQTGTGTSLYSSPVSAISRDDWNTLSSTSSSTTAPAIMWCDRSEHPIVIWLWGTPSVAGSLIVSVHSEAPDANAGAVTVGLEPLWYEYVKFEVAWQMAIAKGIDMTKVGVLGSIAKSKKTVAVRAGKETGGFMMEVS